MSRDGSRKYGTLLNEYVTILRPNPPFKIDPEG
jgi:hypothetical protein